MGMWHLHALVEENEAFKQYFEKYPKEGGKYTPDMFKEKLEDFYPMEKITDDGNDKTNTIPKKYIKKGWSKHDEYNIVKQKALDIINNGKK